MTGCGGWSRSSGSLFAQDLRTLLPVSAKRLDEQLQLALRESSGLAVVGTARGAGQR